MRRLGGALAFAAALAAAPAPALAAGLSDVVPERPGLTNFDLLKLVVTDLSDDGKGGATGKTPVPFEHIEGKDARADPSDRIEIGDVETARPPGEPDRLVVLADLGPSEGNVANAQVLALFALAPKPRLVDIVEVGVDREVWLRQKTPLPLGPRAWLMLVDSAHGNSNQSYESVEMIALVGDKFRLVGVVSSFGDGYCSYRRTQEPSFATLPGAPYRAIAVTVEEVVERTGQDCGDEKPPRAGKATYRVIYRWEARRQAYATTSRELERLAKENQKRM